MASKSASLPSKITAISLPADLHASVIQLAKAKGVSASSVIRQAVYGFLRMDAEARALQEYGRLKAKERGIKTEEDIERLVDAVRS